MEELVSPTIPRDELLTDSEKAAEIGRIFTKGLDDLINPDDILRSINGMQSLVAAAKKSREFSSLPWSKEIEGQFAYQLTQFALKVHEPKSASPSNFKDLAEAMDQVPKDWTSKPGWRQERGTPSSPPVDTSTPPLTATPTGPQT